MKKNQKTINRYEELSDLEYEVLMDLRSIDKISDEKNDTLSLGQRLSDKIADFGGSWTFITIFMVILISWMIINAVFLKSSAFDPYPFILLNLVLSCIAALQAPIIMMSQNRQEEKDRERAKKDYQINLRAELEIRLLHQKLDEINDKLRSLSK
ncbi:MAG: DUF1003 domain-containing protein [Spirosomataceae bacterium]